MTGARWPTGYEKGPEAGLVCDDSSRIDNPGRRVSRRLEKNGLERGPSDPLGYPLGMKGRTTAWLCVLAAILTTAPVRSAEAPAKVPTFPVPMPGSGAGDLSKLRQRLARVDSADVSRACGNLSLPWVYRGPVGRRMALRTFGRRHGGRDWAEATARLMVEHLKPDTTLKRRGQAACDQDGGPPVFLSTFFADSGPTLALMSFQEDFVEVFDADGSLGAFRLSAGTDSLWAALGSVLDTDPLLRGPRPEVSQRDTLPAWVYVDELPDVEHRRTPEYPADAQEQGVSGVVFIRALVGEDGNVHDAYVENGPPLLRDAALEAVWQWEFKPAMMKDKPVAVWVGLPVKFSLH